MISLPLALTLALAIPGTETTKDAAQEEEQASGADEAPPFTDAQLDYLEKMRDELREEAASAAPASAEAAPSKLELRAEAYMKWLYRNDATQGCVTYGNPHPTGDNYSGNNGACPELALTLIGRPIPKLEGGFRLQSRFGQDFADWFENGDRRARPDASAESLGQNHSAPIQLRGIYVRIAEPLPGIQWFLAGSSDLSYWDAWTVGKVRFIDRFNAKGIFLKTGVPDALDVLVARIAMPKLFGTANYSSLEEPLVTNPFWARDAVYALQLQTSRRLIEAAQLTVNAALLLDEEADTRDPDAAGSINTIDPKDQVTAAAGRFVGANGSLTVEVTGVEAVRLKGVLAISHNDPSADYVTNLARGGLGFSNVVFDTATDFATTLRVQLPDLAFEGFGLSFEYFNIGSDFNAVMGARREDDVLLTDGFLDGGELPTLNLANELVDFNDAFYESIIGWHGGTALLEINSDFADLKAEATFLTYNTNLQGRDMDVYPGFGGFTGYTDTQLFSYANTNDRGTDPRTVYHRDQDRRTLIVVAGGALKPSWWKGARIEAQAKLIFDNDGRNIEIPEDDYAATIIATKASIGAQLLDELSATIGVGLDHWTELARSGTFAGGQASFDDYTTLRLRPFFEAGYSIGPLSARYHLEAVRKTVDLLPDPEESYSVGWVVRSIGWLSAQF
jgi:hypothetical protein